jgi:hypothetical protein
MGARTTIRGSSRAWRLATSFAFAAAVLGLLAAVSPPSAFGGRYVARVCTKPPSGGAGEDLELAVDLGTVGFGVSHSCNTGVAEITQSAMGPSVTGGSRWALRAPPGTTIRELTGFRDQSVWGNPDVIWEIRNNTERLERISSTVADEPVTYAVNSDLVFASLQCARRPCLPPPGQASLNIRMGLRDVFAELEDNHPPTVAIDLPPGAELGRGPTEIPFVAQDEGSGIVGSFLYLDGRGVSSVFDSNGGKCTLPIRFLAPCKTDLHSSIALDTTGLSEGRHQLKVEVQDVGGSIAQSELVPIEVHDPPEPVRPSPPSPSPLQPPSAGPPLIADRTAPVLSGVSLSRKRFRVGKAPTALAARAKALGGTVLRFSSSEAGTLSIAVSKAKKGAKPIGTLTRSIAAGPGKVPFSGRIGKKPLRPGRYRLTLSARDAAGNVSSSVAIPFMILVSVELG